VNTALSDALRSGLANPGPIGPSGYWEVTTDPNRGLGGYCQQILGRQCSWDAFKTLALCSSSEDITREIILEDNRVFLPALRDFLQKDQDPPSFQSGLHGYTNKSDAAIFPATSVSDGTTLPNLAEVYYLFYDGCADSDVMDKSNITLWKAYKGKFQFCIQTLNASTKLGNEIGTNMFLMDSTADLNWKPAIRDNSSAFCTSVHGENKDFCVSEPFMQRLAFHMNLIFNTTAIFSNPNRSDILYSSEWGPLLVEQLYRYCGRSDIPFSKGFPEALEGIAHSLTNMYAPLTPLLNPLFLRVSC
jgi:hypothetical protein